MHTGKQKIAVNMTINGRLVNSSVQSPFLSKKYVHILVGNAILNIPYRRLHLDEDDFDKKQYEGIPLVIFGKDKPKDPLVEKMERWVKGVAHAIDKDYLRQVFIFMKDGNDEILESYNIYIRYNKNPSEQQSKKTPNDVKLATKAFLQAIVNLGQVEKLGRETRLSLELTYENDTPLEYEPPGFEAVIEGDCLKHNSNSVLLASVTTGYHKITARCNLDQIPIENADSTLDSIVIDDDVPDNEIAEAEASSSQVKKKRRTSEGSPQQPATAPVIVVEAELEHIERDYETSKTTAPVTVVEAELEHIERDYETSKSLERHDSMESISSISTSSRCVCEWTFNSINLDEITCVKCRRSFHGICVGFFDKSVYDSHFKCNKCRNEFDAVEIKFNSMSIKLIAQIRLVLYFIHLEHKIPKEILLNMTQLEKSEITTKLQITGVIPSKARKHLTQGNFNLATVKAMISKIFSEVENSEYLS